ncbi:MAG TPA: HAMP domain-containing protein, partial [Ktedonobacteraceae bacterium]|nr:HAMP domain-containing protein [Ktedonobacteraceae bacterium]
MNISHQQPPNVIFEDLGPVKFKKRGILPPLPFPSLPPFKNPLIGIPIAQRLVFGFLIPALIAALASAIIGIQSAQLLNQESDFYQNLFQSYSSLTTGNDFLQLMNFKLNATLSDAQVLNPSHDQLTTDQKAVQALETRYDTLLQDYVQHDLLIHNPSQTALFDGAGHSGQGAQQSLLASSTVRTWQLYRAAQDQILQEVQNGLYQDAQTLEQKQGQVTYSDALSSLRQLIQFDGRLTTYVQDATSIQQTSGLITTLIAVILVLSSIGVIGWLIYGTLVDRLRQLRKVAQAVQRGQIDTRVVVDGRDEITDVSTSVNTMLDTIVGLLEQTQVQRDVLISAAERLFSDMRLANGGEFDVKTAVNNDPIWMLGHAFNFTIGRFRRFVMRNQTTIEQLDVVSQQGMENANIFLTNTRKILQNTTVSLSSSSTSSGNIERSRKLQESVTSSNTDFSKQVIVIRDQLQYFARQNVEPLGANLLDLLERASRLCQQVMAEQLSSHAPHRNTVEGIRSLEMLLERLGMAVQTFHKSTAKGLAEVYANINQLSITARSASTENTRNTSSTSNGLTSTQVNELARLTEGFAREVTGLAQSLRRITEEMRSSLAPFRLDTPQSNQQAN